jgi:hypothetical protein
MAGRDKPMPRSEYALVMTAWLVVTLVLAATTFLPEPPFSTFLTDVFNSSPRYDLWWTVPIWLLIGYLYLGFVAVFAAILTFGPYVVLRPLVLGLARLVWGWARR